MAVEHVKDCICVECEDRLRAAAPDLLAALERIVTYSRDADCGDHCSNACMYCQARAAIRKARE